MTATMHIGRRVTPYHPYTGLRARWGTFALKHFRRTQVAYFETTRARYPLSDAQEYRHALDAPALEGAFAHLAIDHPDAVTPADGGTVARERDREQLLLAACDRWFRDAHGPEHRWSPRKVAAYDRLMADVRACFHSGGTS